MAFSEFEQKRFHKIVDAYVESRRPPPHIRDKLDIAFRFKGQSFEIFEIRPMWRRPDKTVEHPIIKATYIKRRNVWAIYWQRADLKWHRYEPEPETQSIEDVLDVAERDEYGCFYG
ncbi:MAG: DUF3024 domain-containing protein [Gammaproteobacteria bacterium]|nr:DUF3024 domain-containing protein [Gammaproteobacteria bacterium]MCZ6889803.1 DUF3024 domain-containing protein [Gammaproteobacteria bacterium]